MAPRYHNPHALDSHQINSIKLGTYAFKHAMLALEVFQNWEPKTVDICLKQPHSLASHHFTACKVLIDFINSKMLALAIYFLLQN